MQDDSSARFKEDELDAVEGDDEDTGEIYEPYKIKEPWNHFYTDNPISLLYSNKSSGPIYLALSIITMGISAYIFEVLTIDNEADALFVQLFWAMFPTISCVLIVRALIGYYQDRRFGTSKLTVESKRGVQGSEMRASLSISKELTPTGEGVATLHCYRCTDPSSHDDKRRIKFKSLWSARMTVSAGRITPRSQIPLRFQLPSGLPDSSLTTGHDTIQWILSVKIPTTSLSYKSSFTIPVFSDT